MEARRTLMRVLANLIALVSLALSWQFLAAFLHWSNGWMEGVSYALGATLLAIVAVQLWLGRARRATLYRSLALACGLPALWCARWTWWLLTRAHEIGPLPAWTPALFGATGLVFLAAALTFANRANHIHSGSPPDASNTPTTPL